MGEVENSILEVMERVAIEHGWKMDVLLWDGGLLRRRTGKIQGDVEALLRLMEAEIAKMGSKVNLCVKPLTTGAYEPPVDANVATSKKQSKAKRKCRGESGGGKRKRSTE